MIDRIDQTILRILEKDGRLSFSSLSEQINLSKTPSWMRVQNLEKQKVITGYRAELNPAALGLNLQAFVQVRVSSTLQREFESAVQRNGSVLACYATTGEADYLLHVIVNGIEDLDELVRQRIASMPGVKGMFTILGLKAIKEHGPIMDAFNG